MEKMDISFVCEYLRIYEGEDDRYLQLCLDSAYAYMDSAIEDFEIKYSQDKFRVRANIVILAIISEMYDSRTLVKNSKYDSPSKMIVGLMTQLQLEG